MDISKYFRESLGIRDNESRLYENMNFRKFNTYYHDWVDGILGFYTVFTYGVYISQFDLPECLVM